MPLAWNTPLALNSSGKKILWLVAGEYQLSSDPVEINQTGDRNGTLKYYWTRFIAYAVLLGYFR